MEAESEEPADPMAYMEMQAQYLRMLAQYYDSAPVPGQKSEPLTEEAAEPEVQSYQVEEPLEEEKRQIETPTDHPYEAQQMKEELPIQGAHRTFEETLEAAMSKMQVRTAPRSPRPVSKPVPKQVQSSPQTPSSREPKEPLDSDPPKPPPRTFLKRGQGQLCILRSSSLSEKPKDEGKSSNPERPEEEAALSFSEDSKESDQDEDSVSYREEVSRLTAALKELQREQLRLKGDKERREKKVRELEALKAEIAKERGTLQKEFEDWRTAELAKLRKDKKQSEQPARLSKAKKEEIERLRSVIKKLEDEAKARDLRHQQQLSKLQTELEEAKAASRPSAALSSVPSLPAEESAADPVSRTVAPDGKVISVFADGKKEIKFPNGVRKEVFPDDFTIIYFTNNDIKQTFPDGKVVYYFADAQTTQTTFPDSLQIFKFANGQTEKHFPDNIKEITFPDGTVKCIFPDGEEESIFPDGTVQKVDANGVKFIDFVNGQKDTIYPDGTKVREFADGRVKKILPNGKVVESS